MKRQNRYVPAEGDAVWITFDPQVGHEQAGRRPALVLSSIVYNGPAGLAVMCPITSHAKGYPFEVPLPNDFPVSGVVLADQVKSLDWQSRKVTRICSIPGDTLAQVRKRIALLLGISVP